MTTRIPCVIGTELFDIELLNGLFQSVTRGDCGQTNAVHTNMRENPHERGKRGGRVECAMYGSTQYKNSAAYLLESDLILNSHSSLLKYDMVDISRRGYTDGLFFIARRGL